jgi:Spy/CpxP family protein refolding chaperone
MFYDPKSNTFPEIRVLTIRSQFSYPMHNQLSKFLAASLFATSLVFAQPAPTPTPISANPPNLANMVQHQVARLTTILTLTTAQQQQATTIFTTSATANQASMSSMRAARTALNTAIKNNDAGGIEQAATTLGNLTAQTTLATSQAQAAFLQILTPDQLTKYNQLGMVGGVGGFGGFGHGVPGAFHGSGR